MRQEGRVTDKEIRFLAVGGTKIVATNPNPCGESGWLSNKQWCTIEEVSELMSFQGLDEEFSKHLDEWEKLSDHNAPFEVDKWPGEVSETFMTFQKLIITNILAPDKIIPGLRYLIATDYG